MLLRTFAIVLVLVVIQSASQAVEIAAGRTFFSIKAPKANDARLKGQWTKDDIPLVRREDGTWSVELDNVPDGIWEYSFLIDGLNVLDPHNPGIKPQRQPSKSILHIPSVPPAAWDWQNIPHGTLHVHDYQSKAVDRQRELLVYTPPGYENSSEKLPLLVLQHGSGDNQRAWTEHGKAHWILDHLIATGKARPMLVVMLDGHPLGSVQREDKSRRDESLNAFRRELLEDAIPLVERNYRVLPAPNHRAIVGLSMGGWQSLTVGLNALDQFAWIGSFSGAADSEAVRNALDNNANTNAKLKLLWIACGRDDFLQERNKALIAELKAADVRHEWYLTEGAHSWPVWRNYLVDFIPRLFQP